MALFSRVFIDKRSLNGLFNRLCKVSKYNNVQVAHINGKMNRVSRPRPPPYPYKEKEIDFFDYIFGYNIERLDENSKIIVVDGPIAAGKDKFARELAKELEMAYMPPPTFDRVCVNGYGFDKRTVDHELPERMQICDVQRFLTNPKHANVPAFEVLYYMIKLEAYLESLLHVFSTGEGVIVNSSCFSNFVFMKAMCNAGYIKQGVRRYYEKAVNATMEYVLRPHLAIYLDIPVDVVQDRIKKRCIPYEVNSEVLTKQFLTDIETMYKEEYLPQIENHAYLLVYDWANGGDISDVVDDIERINMEYNQQNPQKLEDWIFSCTTDFISRQCMYSREQRHAILMKGLIPDFEVSEMFLFGEDVKKEKKFFEKYEPKYEYGYNRDKGDSILWQTKDGEYVMYPCVITNKELLTT